MYQLRLPITMDLHSGFWIDGSVGCSFARLGTWFGRGIVGGGRTAQHGTPLPSPSHRYLCPPWVLPDGASCTLSLECPARLFSTMRYPLMKRLTVSSLWVIWWSISPIDHLMGPCDYFFDRGASCDPYLIWGLSYSSWTLAPPHLNCPPGI